MMSFSIFENEEQALKKLAEKIGILRDIEFAQKDRNYQLKALENILKKISAIPYENITKHINRKLISPYDIIYGFEKWGTGATCFPLVYLLKRILDFCHIESRIILADRTYAQRSHTLVLVQIKDKTYIADIGFLVFSPIEVSEKSVIASLPQGDILFSLSGNTLEAYTVFRNGHKKFRYKAYIDKVDKDDFISAWEESYNLEMMNHVIVSKLVGKNIIYIRDNFVHFIEDGVSKNLKMQKEEVLKVVESIGIDKKLFSDVWQYLLNPNQ